MNDLQAKLDTAQAQLAEADDLLTKVMHCTNFREVGEVEMAIAVYFARHAQAEQQEAKPPLISRILNGAFDTSHLEAQGAQAGYEDAAFMVWAEREYQTGPDEELNLKHLDVIQNRKGWMARAAQPAAIKLPPRQEYKLGRWSFFDNYAVASWNQCLDAVQKLNAVRGAEHE